MTSWRWQALGASVLCFGFAALAMCLASSDMGHLLRGLGEGRVVVTSSPYAGAGLIGAVFLLSVGLLLLFSREATSEQMRNVSARTARWSRRYMLFLVAILMAAALAPVVQHVVVGVIAKGRGYVACPRPSRPRRQPDRWALPGPHGPTERCPGEGADPNV